MREVTKYMKIYGCKFCNDLRNIEPASDISGDDDNFKKWINKAIEKKKFILVLKDKFVIVDKCPKCGYGFTEEDYDSYL